MLYIYKKITEFYGKKKVSIEYGFCKKILDFSVKIPFKKLCYTNKESELMEIFLVGYGIFFYPNLAERIFNSIKFKQ